VQELEATVARREQRALEQHGTDPVALPRLLDGEGGFSFAGHRRPDRSQLRGAAQNPVDEKAMNDGIDPERQIGIVANELVGHRAGKAVAATVGIETQQMVAIVLGFADPQFPDQASLGQRVMHRCVL